MHACMNRALDMQNGLPDRLKLLYDIHLLLGRMDDQAWDALIELARAKNMAGVCLRSIDDTIAVFATTALGGDPGVMRGRGFRTARPPPPRRLALHAMAEPQGPARACGQAALAVATLPVPRPSVTCANCTGRAAGCS